MLLQINPDKIKLLDPFEETSSTDNFQENFDLTFSSNSSRPSLLPAGLLYVGSSLVVFERPPRYQEINFVAESQSNARRLSKETYSTFNVPLPWQVYIGKFHSNGSIESVWMYFSDTEIESVILGPNRIGIFNKSQTALHFPALTNVYSDFHFCIDDTVYYADDDSIENRMNSIYTAVWDTVFNLDLIDGFNHVFSNTKPAVLSKVKTPGLNNHQTVYFKAWQSMTIQEVLIDFSIFAPIGNNFSISLPPVSKAKAAAYIPFINNLSAVI